MESSFRYQKEGAAKDLVGFMMNDYGWKLSQALEVLFNSETYSKICNPATGLYFQSSRYLYSFLKNEIDTGVMR